MSYPSSIVKKAPFFPSCPPSLAARLGIWYSPVTYEFRDVRKLTFLSMTDTYRMVGKFGGNLIWRIGLQFHLADFNLAVLFLRAMMSYVIITRRIRNPNAPPSSNVRSRCRSANMELCIESCVRGQSRFQADMDTKCW